MSYEKMCCVGVIQEGPILACGHVHFFFFMESGQIQKNGQVKCQEGEQLLKSEGHQVQMFDVTRVIAMHSGYTASPKSIHVFLDL